MLQIKQIGFPTLTQKAETVKDFSDPELKNLISEMLDTLKKGEDFSAGLAANQVGVLKRLTIVKRLDLENKPDFDGTDVWEVMVNPIIVKKSDVKSIYWEGCLSINNGNLFGQVERPRRVTVEYQNSKGDKKVIKADGYFSHLLQHEIDHLDGILFTSYIKDPSELYTSQELDKMD